MVFCPTFLEKGENSIYGWLKDDFTSDKLRFEEQK